MILDETNVEDVHDEEYAKYLKLIYSWGYIIFISGIVLLLFLANILHQMSMDSLDLDLFRNKRFLVLISFAAMPITALLSGWRLIQIRQNINNQAKGYFWLKLFWCFVMLTLMIFFFTM